MVSWGRVLILGLRIGMLAVDVFVVVKENCKECGGDRLGHTVWCVLGYNLHDSYDTRNFAI